MAILEEANLLAERARHAKHRTHHVGTKLNEGELAGGRHMRGWVPHPLLCRVRIFSCL